MAQFRKKPVVIEAVQFDGTFGSVESMNIPSCSQSLGTDTLGSDFHDITTLLVLRFVGVFIAPLGAVLGYF